MTEINNQRWPVRVYNNTRVLCRGPGWVFIFILAMYLAVLLWALANTATDTISMVTACSITAYHQ